MTVSDRAIAIVQARMSSTRLPGKVLMELGGKPMILFMMDRLARAEKLDGLCVATSDDASDDPLAEVLENAGVICYRGSLNDVLDRFVGAAQVMDAGIVVRLTGDCPLIDTDIIDRSVTMIRKGDVSYVSNTNPPSYPDGLDVEAMTVNALKQAAAKAKEAYQREHVTPFIRENPDQFPHYTLTSSIDLSEMRWTVDHFEDLDIVRDMVQAAGDRAVLADRFDFLRCRDRDGLRDASDKFRRNEKYSAE